MKSASRSLALVIGATGAVGFEIAKGLTSRGFEVLGTYCNTKPQTVGMIANATWVRFDASTTKSAVNVAKAIAETRLPLSVVVYAIGLGSSKQTVFETSLDEFTKLFAVNVAGFAAIWQAIAEMGRMGRARVIALGSDASRSLSVGNGSYSVSKVALEALVMTLAKEEAQYGVRFNIVAPSTIDSPLARRNLAMKKDLDSGRYFGNLPWGRPLNTMEVAKAVISIGVDDQWKYASGQVFRLAANLT